MAKKKVTADDVADAFINLNETMGICDEATAKGFRSSKKKDILKSGKEGSFSKFEQEIKKRQDKKD